MLREKRLMREIVKKEVRQLSDSYCKEADRAILENIRALPQYRQARTVFCYVGTETEINTAPLLEDILESGKTLGVPKCISKGIMRVYRIESLKELKPGAYGIPEPEEGGEVIEPERIDLAIIPCLCCDKKGHRLGYGGGFYDRYLEKGNFIKAVLCREKLMKEAIPTEPHDIVMDLVISEKGVY